MFSMNNLGSYMYMFSLQRACHDLLLLGNAACVRMRCGRFFCPMRFFDCVCCQALSWLFVSRPQAEMACHIQERALGAHEHGAKVQLVLNTLQELKSKDRSKHTHTYTHAHTACDVPETSNIALCMCLRLQERRH